MPVNSLQRMPTDHSQRIGCLQLVDNPRLTKTHQALTYPASTFRHHYVIWLLLTCLLLIGLFSHSLRANAEVQDLTQHWQYRWGDSPYINEQPQWILKPDHPDWHKIDFPSNPPSRNNQTNVWYRTQIPEGHWHDPVLYIYSVDLIVQVYLEDHLIYQYGAFDANGQGKFSGWPWHMIPLPPDATGKPLYFRVFSNYLDIGLWGEVKIMERLELLQMIWSRSVENLIITGFTLLIALLSLLFAIHKAQRQVFIPLALFAFCAAGLALTSTQAKQLILHQPLFWDYLAASSYYLLPTALIFLLSQGFQLLTPVLSRVLKIVFIGYLLSAISLSLLGIVNLSNTYPLFDALFVCLVPLTLLLSLRHPRLNLDQKVILTASTLMTILLILDMAVAHNWISWSQVPVGWGTLIFSLALVVLALRHYFRTQNTLAELNASLEQRVQKRTEELNNIAERESRRAEALSFAHYKSEQLAQYVARLSQYSHLDEAITYLKPCIPELLHPLSGLIYWNQGHSFDREAYWQREDDGFNKQFPAQLTPDSSHDLIFPHNWRRYQLQYEQPKSGTQVLAIIWVDLTDNRSRATELEPLTLETLIDRGVERINLTLSQLALKSALNRFSYEDGLTGLKNRRYLDQTLPELLETARSQSTPLSLLICDIDHFKRFNDHFGHMAGDEVLRQVADQMTQLCNHNQLLSRFGGEEFVLVLPDTDSKDAVEIAEQLRQHIEQLELRFDGEKTDDITLSLGVCSLDQHSSTSEQLLHNADQALYQAKHNGRNQVILYQPLQAKHNPHLQPNLNPAN